MKLTQAVQQAAGGSGRGGGGGAVNPQGGEPSIFKARNIRNESKNQNKFVHVNQCGGTCVRAYGTLRP